MSLALKLVFSRIRKQKIRTLFVILTIAATSCLVVWVIGGYRTLFTEMIGEDSNPMGHYDLKVLSMNMISDGMGASGNTPQRGRGGGFSGPFQGPRSAISVSQENKRNHFSQDLTNQNKAGQAGPQQVESRQSETEEGTRPTNRHDQIKQAINDRFAYSRNKERQIELGKLSDKVPAHILKKFKIHDKNNDGLIDREEEKLLMINQPPSSDAVGRPGEDRSNSRRGKGMNRQLQGRPELAIPREFIQKIRSDSEIDCLDETATARAFVYYKGMESFFTSDEKEIKEEKNWKENVSLVPDGIDPELHFGGFKAYRASMGTPGGLGKILTGTTARQAPDKMMSGSWFTDLDHHIREVVFSSGAAERTKIRPGESILLIANTGEYQLKVTGIIEERGNTIYIPMKMAEKITGSRPQTISLSIVLKKGTSAEAFKNRWNPELEKSASGLHLMTTGEVRESMKKIESNKKTFNWQTVSSALVAVFVSIVIIFTTLNMSVNEQKRQLALLRSIGLTRTQTSAIILTESFLLSISGWFFGLLSGWLLLGVFTGKIPGMSLSITGLTFLCSVIGAVLAAIIPMLKSFFVRPLEAIETSPFGRGRTDRPKNNRVILIMTLIGFLFLSVDLLVVHFLKTDPKTRLFGHATFGIASLAVGTLLLIPAAVKITEWIFIPILAFLFHLNAKMLRSELTGNMFRTTATAAALSIGGGIFIAMQIWGYSMLGPFLPGKEMPDALAAFLPQGLYPSMVDELQKAPFIKKGEFLPLSLEQAEFANGSVKTGDRMTQQFANVILFGADVDRAFGGDHPMIKLRFRKGNLAETLAAMKNSRGCVISDTIAVDYKLDKGDTLKLTHPKDPSRIIEYPIVGVVYFPGSQWLCKTSGVRRNFGRSGGMVFLSGSNVWNDFNLDRYSYFWFNTLPDISYNEMETALDRLAAKNWKLSNQSKENTTKENFNKGVNSPPFPNPAASAKENIRGFGIRDLKENNSGLSFVKLTTRESLSGSIFKRADGVIWGISTMPLVTLVITSIAVIGVIVNSVRARRWQFGIMRAVGITRGAVVRMILIESVLIGIVSVIASFLFGFLSAQGGLKLGDSMFGSADPPIILPWTHLVFGIGLMLFLCFLAAVQPAINTGRKQPLELLQEGRDIN